MRKRRIKLPSFRWTGCVSPDPIWPIPRMLLGCPKFGTIVSAEHTYCSFSYWLDSCSFFSPQDTHFLQGPLHASFLNAANRGSVCLKVHCPYAICFLIISGIFVWLQRIFLNFMRLIWVMCSNSSEFGLCPVSEYRETCWCRSSCSFVLTKSLA